MITGRHMRDAESGGTVVRDQISGEIGIPAELVFREEANDRPHPRNPHFANPAVHRRSWDRHTTFARVSGSPTTRQFIFEYPLDHAGSR